VQHLLGALVDLHRITGSRRVVQSGRAAMALDLSDVGAVVLRHVATNGPIRPAGIAERLRMLPSALSRQLKNLEDEGLVERVPSPGDKRGSLVRATRRGRALVRRIEQTEQQLLAEQLHDWSDTDLRRLVGLMDRLVHDLRTPVAVAEERTRRTG
jgi:DNA-binding MarR family transcriptional regulator